MNWLDIYRIPWKIDVIMALCDSCHFDCQQNISKSIAGGGGEGWDGGGMVLCIFHHGGVQLILAYSWGRPGTLVAGKGRGGIFYFFCFFTFIPVPLSSLSLSFISSTISSISFLPFSGRRPTRVDVSLNPNTIKFKLGSWNFLKW